ncbi:class I poly(R)-hydroxyalkanoic acid synthase [Paracoccus spongiarum]|uniref:Class I poly(R)-hydroxyalkanoic acid synthase n=1 Tax=Paracoccus spongiarum TaxID=3064387 RepID=A0ABT9J963_9RHOB|nr:class I poly(R)-hydroxyalkanoic acid synthase [Paracoccus sp. 2205BS29-5]MDP5306340.1 class I poly(R)-hydroxyalkanoic acid synthase [Paracoccus sp. 2205BS29-5]
MSRAASTAASDASAAQGPDLDRLAEAGGGPAARRLVENIERIEALSSRLVAALTDRAMPNPGVEAPGPELLMTTASAWMKTLADQPARVIERQVSYWGETLQHYTRAQMALARGKLTAPEDDAPGDKRFKNPLWQSHPYFNFVKNQYLINARALETAARDLDLPDEVARRRVDWMTRQLVDMMAPTNFLATNPDALERAVQTEGESLVRGLENLVRDVEQSGGEMVVSLADREAFTVGENIGTSEGSVVHRAPLYELIQYRPLTDQVHALPLLIFPPWINKFYILDLKPQNSLIRWLLEQGHTLFIVSWKNPDASFADIGMEDYVGAYLDAMDRVRSLTGQPRLNVVGYCIAGTTLALTLALLQQRGDDRVNCATLFTTLTDFSDQGEFTTYLQDDFVNGIADEVERHGLLRAQLMSRTMSFLRANDLVWGPAIRSYMLGETPPAFDLLYWNGDATNLPGRMALQYLRGLCQQNRFAGDGFDLMGHRLTLGDVQVPLCAVACENDHIAPWQDCWRGVAQMGARDKTFILSQSGHIAGIVNPPGRRKYGHYAGGRDFDHGHEAWRESSGFDQDSWWPLWGAWLAERAGVMVPARAPDSEVLPAPGSYVHERAG